MYSEPFNRLFAYQDDGLCGGIWVNDISNDVNAYHPARVLVLLENGLEDAVGVGDGLKSVGDYAIMHDKNVEVKVVPSRSIVDALDIIKASDADCVYWNIGVESLIDVTPELMTELGAIEKHQTFVYWHKPSSLRKEGEIKYAHGLEPDKAIDYFKPLNIKCHEGSGLSMEQFYFKNGHEIYREFHRDGAWVVLTENEVMSVPVKFFNPRRRLQGTKSYKVEFLRKLRESVHKQPERVGRKRDLVTSLVINTFAIIGFISFAKPFVSW